MPEDLTLRKAQRNQPWTLPYSSGVVFAFQDTVPHILGTHAVLHAMKSVGKLSSVFEALDHPEPGIPRDNSYQPGPAEPNFVQLSMIADMAADLVVVALRLANLYDFDLEDVLVRRVIEKNAKGFEG